MPHDQIWYQWQGEALLLKVQVQPRAKRDELIGPQGGYLKVRITAPPVDGKANDHLRRFLATELGVPPSRVELVAGMNSRLKRLRILAPGKLPAIIEPK
jgi:uncharacterized protein (TIGR00251 family)